MLEKFVSGQDVFLSSWGRTYTRHERALKIMPKLQPCNRPFCWYTFYFCGCVVVAEDIIVQSKIRGKITFLAILLYRYETSCLILYNLKVNEVVSR